LVIRLNHKTGEVSLDPLRWGLIPYWSQDPKGGRKPINAKCETVHSLPTFRDAYRRRRCILPVDGFFEWKAIKGQKAKQPYAIAMKNGSPFGIGGLWENWKDPTSGEWMRTFAIITTDANELVAEIHGRMPLILAAADYARWLSDEPDPRDLMRPFPAQPMRMWPISTRVNKPENDRVSYFGGVVELRATALARRAYCKGLIEDRTSRRALCRRDKTGSASFENSGLEPSDRFHS
jgi:putative SOS response-associated peptidase YedK